MPSSPQSSWHRGTSSFSALALLPCVLACVHVSVRSIVGLLSRVQPTHPTVSAFTVLARSVAFCPSPQGFRPHSFVAPFQCPLSTQVTPSLSPECTLMLQRIIRVKQLKRVTTIFEIGMQTFYGIIVHAHGRGGGLTRARFKREITTCSHTKEIITLVPKRVYSIKK